MRQSNKYLDGSVVNNQNAAEVSQFSMVLYQIKGSDDNRSLFSEG